MTGLPHLRDVSSWQPTVDWTVEARETAAVYVKVSQGVTYLNPAATSQIAGARKARLRVGGYHYCTPGVGSGEQQADILLAHAPWKPGDLRPCLDCEWPDSPLNGNRPQLAAWYLAAVTRVVARTGIYPVLYGSFFYLQGFAALHGEVFGRCPLWIADYTTAKTPGVPAPWHSWAAWQWTQANRDPAITGLTDDSLVADLDALLVPNRTVARTVSRRRARKASPPPDWVPKPRVEW